MPYVKKSVRDRFSEDFLNDICLCCYAPGDVNFVISKIMNGVIQSQGLDYVTINSLIGALECAKMELYRRIAVPYEDAKIKENGDVYECAKAG